MQNIGVPTVSGITNAIKSGAVGAVGGILVGLSNSLFGNGIVGGLAGIGLAGSAIKGVQGEIIATVLGFEIGKNIMLGNMFSQPAATVSNAFQAI